MFNPSRGVCEGGLYRNPIHTGRSKRNDEKQKKMINNEGLNSRCTHFLTYIFISLYQDRTVETYRKVRDRKRGRRDDMANVRGLESNPNLYG